MHQPGTFYDVVTNEEPQYHLDRANDTEFRLLRRFGYVDLKPPHHQFQVPKDLTTFHTDLTSTPAYFTWLVPSTGAHLPAALLHDGLVFDEATEEISYIGPPISRLEADRIFRDAMKAIGTGPVRRWIIWSAVALATSWADLTPRLWWRTLGILTALTMLALGTLATLDLLDVIAFFPWMGDRPFLTEFITGGIGAIVVPMVICIPWWRLYVAALIATILFAFLIHVTVVIAILLALYESVEWIAIRIESAVSRFQTSPVPPERPGS
jgi:hypothetical protein